ncbi:hypothetical protein D7D81_07085 [Halocella sp. SP3-1]|nr:hypothetical protein D7D81_07085 [Halocella sp. SP3-1]
MGENKERQPSFAFEKLPIDKERTVNDKELLTFTNLTNLKWEFADIFSGNDDEKKRSTRLSEVLKDPERFVRGYRDPVKKEDPIYVYGTDIQGNYHGKETGLKELRKEAGIAMEYLEKDEGEFLNNPVVMIRSDRL